MIGLGTIINTAAIIVGGLLGLLCGRLITDKIQETMIKACGLCTIFLGASGALELMLGLKGTVTGGVPMIAISLAVGSFAGEALDLDSRLERFGQWLKEKSGSSSDTRFVDAFVTASLSVCIGAMAIVGSIQDGISGDYSTLLLKGILDFIIILVMASSLGKGCLFSAIPVGLFQGSVTLLARLVEPLLTAGALSNLSLVGSVLIFCVGLNLIWKNTIRVANLLPALVVAVAYALLGF